MTAGDKCDTTPVSGKDATAGKVTVSIAYLFDLSVLVLVLGRLLLLPLGLLDRRRGGPGARLLALSLVCLLLLFIPLGKEVVQALLRW